jgi:diguanylate cyclase (GGDEF)-like protein
LDVPTLIAATTLLLVLASLALTAHWLANLGTMGLRGAAFGVIAATVGSYLLIPTTTGPTMFTMLLGDILILFSHMVVWLSIATFWTVRSRMLTYLAMALMLVAAVALSSHVVGGYNGAARGALLSAFVAIFSFGTVLTLVRALGGRRAFYRGIIKRTSVGAAIAAVLFLGHSIFHVYRSYEWRQLPETVMHFDSLGLAVWTQVESMIFVLMLALTVIIMTAERLQNELKIQAMMDPLTQALSRRAFMTVIKTVVARSRRLSEPVSLIMIDIDRFKRINLRHGHLVGDMVLSQFGERVMAGRRAQDVFCRFGGEEFVLLLPGTSEEGAGLVAERVRSAVCDTPFLVNDKEVSLTLSIGVMTARGDDLVSDGMLDAAYKAMKAAQRKGAGFISEAGNMPPVPPAE